MYFPKCQTISLCVVTFDIPNRSRPDQRRPDKRKCIHVDNICAISNMNPLCRAGWTIVRMPHSSSNSCGSELNILHFSLYIYVF